MSIQFLGQGGGAVAQIQFTTPTHIASVYVATGGIDTDDFLGDFEVRLYDPITQTNVGVMNKVGDTPGDSLNSGNFGDISDNDPASEALYSTTGASGGAECAGPKRTIGSATNIYGAKWITYGGSGRFNPVTETEGQYIYGSSIRITDGWDIATSGLPELLGYRNKVLDVSDTKVPQWDEIFAIGGWAPDTPNTKLRQQWTYLLMEGNPPAYDGVTVHFKGNIHIKGLVIK